MGNNQSTKGGIGTASIKTGSGISVAAIIAVNAFGDVVNPANGQIIAGPRNSTSNKFESTNDLQLRERDMTKPNSTNTTIGVVAVNQKPPQVLGARSRIMCSATLDLGIGGKGEFDHIRILSKLEPWALYRRLHLLGYRCEPGDNRS